MSSGILKSRAWESLRTKYWCAFAGISTATFKPRLNICKCGMHETEILYLIDFVPDDMSKAVGITVEM